MNSQKHVKQPHVTKDRPLGFVEMEKRVKTLSKRGKRGNQINAVQTRETQTGAYVRIGDIILPAVIDKLRSGNEVFRHGNRGHFMCIFPFFQRFAF